MPVAAREMPVVGSHSSSAQFARFRNPAVPWTLRPFLAVSSPLDKTVAAPFDSYKVVAAFEHFVVAFASTFAAVASWPSVERSLAANSSSRNSAESPVASVAAWGIAPVARYPEIAGKARPCWRPYVAGRIQPWRTTKTCVSKK